MIERPTIPPRVFPGIADTVIHRFGLQGRHKSAGITDLAVKREDWAFSRLDWLFKGELPRIFEAFNEAIGSAA